MQKYFNASAQYHKHIAIDHITYYDIDHFSHSLKSETITLLLRKIIYYNSSIEKLFELVCEVWSKCVVKFDK